MDISEVGLLDILPRFMQEDVTAKCLATSADYILQCILDKLPLVNLFDNLELLTEEDLDYIAKAQKIPWYDTAYGREKKIGCIRNFERECIILGTPQAVENVSRDLFGKTEIEEWFEYGGEEKHFRLKVEMPDESRKAEEMVKKKIRYVKNLRSVLDEIERARNLWENGNYGCTVLPQRKGVIKEEAENGI